MGTFRSRDYSATSSSTLSSDGSGETGTSTDERRMVAEWVRTASRRTNNRKKRRRQMTTDSHQNR